MRIKHISIVIILVIIFGGFFLGILNTDTASVEAVAFYRTMPTYSISPIGMPMPFVSPIVTFPTYPSPFAKDLLLTPLGDPQQRLTRTGSGYGPTEAHTGDYLLGEVTVAIILLESNEAIDPNLENWSQTEANQVSTEVLAGLNWWYNQAKAVNIPLKFVISPGHPIIVPTSYEPISRSTSDEGLWIDQAMTYLGYNNHSQSSYLLEVQDYINDQRQSLRTDWGVVIFVVDSSADPDGQFLGGGVPMFGITDRPIL